ncbi:MAG: PspC domain-containing protein [Alistipes sp.]|nr:PspC domain-containing protein [Alistipes sp.]
MKETINVNIGGRAFVVDYDAYDKLRIYLSDVKSRLEDSSTMEDIEVRIAEILSESISSMSMVVTLPMAESAIVRIGPAEQFGAVRNGHGDMWGDTSSPRALRRSRTDRSIAGICGGLAKYLHIDATALRIVMLIAIIFGGMSLWVYIILWLLIPEE